MLAKEVSLGAVVTGAPVVLDVTQETLERLLGTRGKALLKKTLDAVFEEAARRDWPLCRVWIGHFRSQEDPDDELINVAFDLKPGVLGWSKAFEQLAGWVDAAERGWSEADRKFMAERVHYVVGV